MPDPHRKMIVAEIQNVEKTLENLDLTMKRTPKTVIELAAIGAFLQSFYNGIENILKQILASKAVDVPSSRMWHKEPLEVSISQGILSEGLVDDLYEYLTFRHFFVHGYGFLPQETKLEPLDRNAPAIWRKFSTTIKAVMPL